MPGSSLSNGHGPRSYRFFSKCKHISQKKVKLHSMIADRKTIGYHNQKSLSKPSDKATNSPAYSNNQDSTELSEDRDASIPRSRLNSKKRCVDVDADLNLNLSDHITYLETSSNKHGTPALADQTTSLLEDIVNIFPNRQNTMTPIQRFLDTSNTTEQVDQSVLQQVSNTYIPGMSNTGVYTMPHMEDDLAAALRNMELDSHDSSSQTYVLLTESEDEYTISQDHLEKLCQINPVLEDWLSASIINICSFDKNSNFIRASWLDGLECKEQFGKELDNVQTSLYVKVDKQCKRKRENED